MPSHDPVRVLREYALEPLRRELCSSGARVLVVTHGDGVGQRSASAGPFDAVWVEIEALEGIDPAALASGIARALRPGGRLVCVLPGAWPLQRLLARGLRGRGEPPGALRARFGATPRRAGFSAWRRAFEPAIEWRRSRGFGVLVPPARVWPRLHPVALGLLAIGEDVMRQWPVVRTLGDWVVHEGVRR
jgi:SAM-dependent methyltransferase